MEGPDHKASITPDELTALVRAVRRVETALGDGVKAPTETELLNRPLVRRRVVAACPIAKGEAFTERNLTVKRPGEGVSPMRWHDLLGTTATQDYAPDDPIRWEEQE